MGKGLSKCFSKVCRHLQDSRAIFVPVYQGRGLGITRSGDFSVAKEPGQRSWEIHQFSDGSRGCQRASTENINTVQGLLFRGDLSYQKKLPKS